MNLALNAMKPILESMHTMERICGESLFEIQPQRNKLRLLRAIYLIWLFLMASEDSREWDKVEFPSLQASSSSSFSAYRSHCRVATSSSIVRAHRGAKDDGHSVRMSRRRVQSDIPCKSVLKADVMCYAAVTNQTLWKQESVLSNRKNTSSIARDLF